MTTSVPAETDFQRLVVEQALEVGLEVESAAGTAPPGRVLDRGEGLLLTRGKEFHVTVFQSMARHTADEAVKKGGAGATAGTAAATRARPRARS